MDPKYEQETQALIRSWDRHDRRALRDYLVQDVEDPRLNVQSILTRHFLLGELFPGRWAALRDHELRFALVMNWLLGLVKAGTPSGGYAAVHTALLDGAGEAEGTAIPAHLRETFLLVPAAVDGVEVPDYVSEQLIRLAAQADERALEGPALATMQLLWRERLQAPGTAGGSDAGCGELQQAPGTAGGSASVPLTVLEPACGSANDYRYLDAYGLARLLDYSGFDLAEKNIRNAREMFPAARFAVGNVLEIAAPDKAYDLLIVHDLFEHLSLGAIEAAVAEVCRVTRRAAAIGFFNMHEGPQHLVRPVDEYYANRLSAPAMQALFERHGATAVESIPIASFLAARFPGATTHNREAYTVIVRF
jgi:SAM-dependent methyltransferase